MAFVNKAVKRDSIIAPTRIHTTPNKRPRKVFGVLSPYLQEKNENLKSYNSTFVKKYFAIESKAKQCILSYRINLNSAPRFI